MDNDNVAIRLKGFIESQGLTNSQFADSCGIPRPTLSQLLGGRNKKISDVLVGQIHKAYPELSVLWLMFGEGKMMTDTNPCSPKKVNATIENIGQEGISSANLFDMDENSADIDTGGVKYENLRPLSKPSKSVKSADNQNDEEGIKTMDLLRQIEKLKKNPRKVSQITIYYDDSTFETFYPKR